MAIDEYLKQKILLESAIDKNAEEGKTLAERKEVLSKDILTELKTFYAGLIHTANKEINDGKYKIELINKKILTRESEKIEYDKALKIIDSGNLDEALSSYQSLNNNKIKSVASIGLALHSYKNGERHTQDWFKENNVEMSPAWKYFTTMEKILELLKGTDEQKAYAQEFWTSLKGEFDNSWSMTASRLEWKKFPEAEYTPNITATEQQKIKLILPVERWINFYEFIKNDHGMKAMNTFLNKQLSREEMKHYGRDVIQPFTGKDEKHIGAAFLNKENRETYKESPVLLGGDGVNFNIGYNNDIFYDFGCARGGA